MIYEAVTHKSTLDKLLDLMSKANISEPRVKPLINFENAASSGAIYKRLVEDMGTVVVDTGILGHVPRRKTAYGQGKPRKRDTTQSA